MTLWRWVSSLRLRVILITLLVVTAVVGAGGMLIIRDVRGEFHETADWLAQARAEDVSRQLSRQGLPRELPEQDDGETLIWVVRDARLVSASAGLAGDRPPVDLPVQAVGDETTLEGVRLGTAEEDSYRVTALGTDGVDGPATVYVAVQVDEIQDFSETAARTGTVGLLLLVVPLGVVLWWAVGRTLAPVEAIRARAATITGQRLSERVPEPPRQDEIGRLARTINEMLERIDVAARDQRRFLADAAHELRSPLASLRTQLEAAPVSSRPTGPPFRDDLLAETLRMQVLVDQFLTLARSEQATLPTDRVPVDLDDVVTAGVAAFRSEHPEARVVLDTTEVHPVQLLGNPALLEQLVRNLVENAARYARTTVAVALARDDQCALLTVDDDGPGIPPDLREEVFKRFMRVDPARDRTNGGAGLGLAIVSDIVASHGGTVQARESPSGGARLRVRLPLDPA